VALFTTPESMVLKLELEKDKLVVSKSSPSLGEAREEIDCEYKGREISIGFNPGYIIDLLKSAEQETLDFELTDPDKPGVVRLGSEYVYVVMPRQID
jgi:DNA polymerase-3 subunit beta